MATQTTIILTDSLDERIQSGVETVTFFDPATGEKREIELGEANRKHFANHLEKLAKYIAASTVVAAPATKAKTAPKSDLDKVRTWARANGFTVGDRGRIKADILKSYAAAQEAVDKTVSDVVESEDVPVKVERREDSIPVTDGFDAADLTDERILTMMKEIEDETGKVDLADLVDKANESK